MHESNIPSMPVPRELLSRCASDPIVLEIMKEYEMPNVSSFYLVL